MVCLCGSTRFMDAIARVAQAETLAGRIVVRPEVVSSDRSPEGAVLDAAAKERLDTVAPGQDPVRRRGRVRRPRRLHGSSTRAELAYAHELGKPIRLVSGSKEDH